MRSAFKLLTIAAMLAGAASCHKQQQQPQTPPQDQNVALDNGIPSNADVETLPPDESSGTSSKELMNGSDNPDVNATDDNSD